METESVKTADKAANETGQKGSFAVLSLWALLAKSSFGKILAVLLLVGAGEMALFYHRLQQYSEVRLLEAIVDESRVWVLFLGALGAVFFILIRTESLLDSAGRYTMQRLKISQTGLWGIKTIYNVLCLLLLFAVQVGLVFGMAWIYRQQAGVNTPQLLFLAFYRGTFLHCLLPMAETGKWVRNALLLLALGMGAAGGTGRRAQVVQAALFALTAVGFLTPVGMTWLEIVCDAAYIVVIAVNMRDAGIVWRRAEQV